MTSKASPKSTSLPEVASGPLQLDLLAGLTTAPSGPQAAPANRSAGPAKGAVLMTQGICGPTWIDSSMRLDEGSGTDPLQLWESRLRDRLATIGSTECELIWRAKDTGLGWSISRLAPWTPPISGRDSIGPRSTWPTPQSVDGAKGSLGPRPHDTGISLPQHMAATMGQWPTPTVADVQGGRKNRSGARSGELLLNGLMTTAPWVTPSSRDWKDSAGMATERDDGRSRLDQLPRQMAATAPTGPTPNGSPATTAKRGAPNPVFACWLMGFPAAWISGASLAMQSWSPPRAKSSQR